MCLLTELDAFYTEHRRCGALDGAVEGDRVWMTCSCGAVLARIVRVQLGPWQFPTEVPMRLLTVEGRWHPRAV